MPEFRDRAFRFESNGLLPISADLQRWFKAYSLNLLTHRNPYTGRALKDDPALVSLELANEDSILAVLGQYPALVPIYRRLCAEQLHLEPAAAEVEQEVPRFALRLQEKYVREMQSFLRENGVHQPLTDLNFRDNQIYALPRSLLDYVDVHAYWSLYHNIPSLPGAYNMNWSSPNWTRWTPFGRAAGVRLFGKPYMNSEFNGCYPEPHWIYTGPVEATLAASQGWSGIFRCGHAADAKRFFTAQPIRQIGVSASPIMMFSERIGALLFSQGEAKPAAAKVPLVFTPEYLLQKMGLTWSPVCPISYALLAFDYQIGTVLLDGHEQLDEFPCVVAPGDMALPKSLEGKTVLRTEMSGLLARVKELSPPASTAKLEFDHEVGKIITARSETFLLPADVPTAHGPCLTVTGNDSVSVCFAGSLDERRLAESRRVLALYLTDAKNTGTQIELKEKDMALVRNAGDLPLLVRQGTIEFSFSMKPERPLPDVWALKYDGSRSVKVDPHRTATGFSFKAQAVTNPETFSAYEITWTE